MRVLNDDLAITVYMAVQEAMIEARRAKRKFRLRRYL